MSCRRILWRMPDTLSSTRGYRLRLARRLTFSLFAQRESKQRESAPDIRPGSSLRCEPGSFAPSALQGSAYKGRPWPFTPFAASLPLNRFHTDSAHPADGILSPRSFVDFRTKCSGAAGDRPPVRRPSRGVAQRGIWHGCQMRNDGPGMALRDDPRSGAGAREVERSEARMPGCLLLLTFLGQARKVRRPAGRNLRLVTEESASFYLTGLGLNTGVKA